MSYFRYISIYTISTLFILYGSGCSTFISSRSQKQPIISDYMSGNYKSASDKSSVYAEDRKNTGDELMWKLEEGSLKFAAGDYKGSIKSFERAEKIIYDFEHRADISLRDYAAEAGTFLTTPNTLPYRGNYSEKIMLNAYKALDYMALGDISGARVELRRAYERQKEAEKRFDEEIREARKEAGKKNFDPEKIVTTAPDFKIITEEIKKHSNQKLADFVNPFVSYLSAIGYLYENDMAEALVDFRRLYEMDRSRVENARNLVTCAKAIGASIPEELSEIKPYDYPLNKNIVYVIYANSIAPARKERKIHIPVPVIYTGVAFPVMEYFQNGRNRHLSVTIPKSEKKHTTSVVADMNSVFGTAYVKELPLIITRMVIAAAARDAGQVALAVGMRDQNPWANLAANAGASAYKALFNRADLRSWQALPGEFQATHFPLPENGKIVISDGNSSKELNLHLQKDKKMVLIYVKSPSEKVLNYKIFVL